MSSTSSIMTTVSMILILHSAYSCLHYRSILQDFNLMTEDTVTTTTTSTSTTTTADTIHGTTTISIPPLDVYIELSIAMFILFIGQLIGTGPLQSVEIISSTGTKDETQQQQQQQKKQPPRKNLAAPAYLTRDFDIYENRAKSIFSSSDNKSD